jgi:diketogulonate reductase-like aldo/keto reductase
LHWREKNTPLAETVETFEKLRSAGKILRWGVSNFDVEDMQELNDEILMTNDEEKRSACSANQVLYNLQHREIEFELLPWSQQNKIPIMAYSPVGHGRGLLENATLKKIAKRHDATCRAGASREGWTPAQIALAWVLSQRGVIAIPKASNKKHVRENAESAKIRLTKQDLQDLDDTFQPPQSKERLAML